MHMHYPGTPQWDDSCKVCIWHEGESKWSHTAVAQYFVTTRVFSWESRKHFCFVKKKSGYGSFIQLTNILLFINARLLFGPKGYTCEHKTNHRAKVQKDHTQRKTLLFCKSWIYEKKERKKLTFNEKGTSNCISTIKQYRMSCNVAKFYSNLLCIVHVTL